MDRFRRFRDRYLIRFTLALMSAGLVFLYLSPFLIVTVPAGHRGVLWRRFGGGVDLARVIAEGTHLILPWNAVTVYDARVRALTERYDVLTRDGLPLGVTMSFLYRVDADHLPYLHRILGPDYARSVLAPGAGARTRTVIAQYGFEDFATTRRAEAQARILRDFARITYRDGDPARDRTLVTVEDALVESVEVPERVVAAVERKVEQAQQVEEYAYRLEVATREAERKRIEGSGVRALFDGVGPAALPDYLRLTGIGATVQLAQSPNAKIVVVGNGPNGLPLILGNLDTNAAAGLTERQAATAPTGPPSAGGTTGPEAGAPVAGAGRRDEARPAAPPGPPSLPFPPPPPFPPGTAGLPLPAEPVPIVPPLPGAAPR